MIAQYATYAMAAILIAAMYLEIRTGRIPNWLTVLPFVIFAVVLAVAEDRSPLYWQMIMAAGLFVLGLLLFAVGGMGAGAVKLIAGAVLFVPFESAFYTLLIYLGVFFVSSVIFIQIRKLFGSQDSKWHLMANPVLPLSFSIGVACISGMFVL